MASQVSPLQRTIGIGGAATFLALLVIGSAVYLVSGFGSFMDLLSVHLTWELFGLAIIFGATTYIGHDFARYFQVALLLLYGGYTLAMADLGSIVGISIGGIGVILAAHYGFFHEKPRLKAGVLLVAAFAAIATQLWRYRDYLELTQTILAFAYSAVAVVGLTVAYFLVLRDAAVAAAQRQSRLESAVKQRTASLEREVIARRAAQASAKESAQEAERLAAERLELLRQVHHRAKNSLQMTISLLESTDSPSGTQLAMTIERVRAIGLVYDLVDASEDLSAIQLEEYLESLLSHLQMSRPEQIVAFSYDTASLHKTRLDPTINLGLMFIEILQAVADYAFWGNPGEIAIEQVDDRASIQYEFRHDGQELPAGIEPETPINASFGLLRAFFARLHATVAIERDQDTRWRITIPKDAIERRYTDDQN